MSQLHRRTFLAAVLITVTSATAVHAGSPITYTTIYVNNMHCAECAKTIAKKLYAVPGVVEVRADVNKNIAYVVPGKEKKLDPKQLWNAVVSAGFAPVKMEGPGGTFTSAPR